jgi:membrane protein DedA with SNARE-associated domain
MLWLARFVRHPKQALQVMGFMLHDLGGFLVWGFVVVVVAPLAVVAADGTVPVWLGLIVVAVAAVIALITNQERLRWIRRRQDETSGKEVFRH